MLGGKMASMSLTIREFFFHQGSQLWSDSFSKIDSCEKLCQLKQKISQRIFGTPWGPTLKSITENALLIFDVSIPEILITAWNKYEILSECTDKNKYPPWKKWDVELISHTVKSVHRPRLEITVNGVNAYEIEFELELALAIHGVILKVQNAKVKEISAGNCRGELRVRCEECLIIERATRTFEFLKPISFGKGIPINLHRGG
jgi:hypothetical protein